MNRKNRCPSITLSFALLGILLLQGHSGFAETASTGSFLVTSEIDYGNAANLRLREETESLNVEFMADPHGGNESLWFCFRIQRTEKSSVRKIEISLANFDNILGGGGKPERLNPVYRYDDGEWKRLEAGTALVQHDGRKYAVWALDVPAQYVDIAACYPYGMPEVERLVAECDGVYRLDTLGLSQEGRPLQRLSNGFGKKESTRPGIYLMARQHSGETPGSWVLDGMLRHFAKEKDRAPLAWCVPLANIDGVENGDYGKDPYPYDLNRAWDSPPMRHETLVFRKDAGRWKRRCKPLLFLDMHAPGYAETAGFYAFGHKAERLDEDERADQERWGKAFKEALGDQAPEEFIKIANYPSRWGGRLNESPINSSGFYQQKVGVTSLSFECTYGRAGEKVYTIQDYREIGARLAETIMGNMD